MIRHTAGDVREEFTRKFKAGEFTSGRGGHKMLEIIGASFVADEDAIFGTVNAEYVEQELNWYASESTNVNDIGEKVPAAWKASANEHGEINSNYGHLIFAKKYHEQYKRVFRELRDTPDSRRAIMVYNRPSIWVEYNENGKNDFICTNAVTYYVRDDKVHAVVQMRSNDVVFGYKNDRAWQHYVLEDLVDDLNHANGHYDGEAEYRFERGDPELKPLLEIGDIHWQVQNLHVYERHFHLIEGQT